MKFQPIQDFHQLYFVTISVSGWKHLFSQPKCAALVLNSLDWLRKQKRIKLYNFCLMPNHLHKIIRVLQPFTLSQVLHSFESFTSHAILKLLKEENKNDLLEYFRQCAKTDFDRDLRFWHDPFVENILSEWFLREKFEYTLNNPINKNWRLVKDRADYQYSCACFYDRDEKPIIEIDDIREDFFI